MKNHKVLIVIPNGHAPRWLQIAVSSLKRFKNKVENDILVMNTWPKHPSIKAITETELGADLMIMDCTIRMHSHATALDQALDFAANEDYTDLFTMETDAVACQDGWLDWFLSFMKDESIGMAGFFWHEGNNHYNINPSGTLYQKDMLLKYHKEVRENKENMFYHPRGNKHGNDGGMDPTIKDVAGVFSETRGIKYPTLAQEDVIMKGVPFASWFEPGAWLYCRSIGEYGGVAVPCDHVYMKVGPVTAPEGTYYGGKADTKYIHLWGGTRAHDFQKHIINDNFVLNGAPYWLEREYRLWKKIVPEYIRHSMPAIYKEIDFVKKAKENLPTWEKLKELIPEDFLDEGGVQ
jgi:hypothetical protein